MRSLARPVSAVLALAALCLAGVRPASAGAPTEPPKNPFLRYSEPQAWTARIQVDVSALEWSTRNRVDIQTWNFQTLAMIFPIIRETSAAAAKPEDIVGVLRVADRDHTRTFTLIDGYPAGAAYGRWDAQELANVRDIALVFESQCRSWETTLNEEAAARVRWPEGDWPTEARSTFEPQYGIEYTAETEATTAAMDEALKRWTEGKDPKSIPPLQLAKYLAGRVQEAVQPTGAGLQGSRTSRRSGFEGFALQGAERTLRSGRGSPFDMAATLAGVYRRAGLPARVVVGLRKFDEYDTTDVTEQELEGPEALHAYVEFFLFDEKTGEAGWIPVDIVRLRKNGSRAGDLNRPWPSFGTHNELDHFIPLAFHFHPPTTVRAYGSPALWGWFVTPEIPGGAFQKLTFATYNTPVRGGERRQTGD